MPRMRDAADRDDFGDQDLMNVDASVLFADPLGIRAQGKAESAEPPVRLSETSTRRKQEAPPRERKTLAELQPEQPPPKAQSKENRAGYPDKKSMPKADPPAPKPTVTPVPVEKPLWQTWFDRVVYALPCSQREREIPEDVKSGKAERPSFPEPGSKEDAKKKQEDAERLKRMKEAEDWLQEQDSEDDTIQKAKGSKPPPTSQGRAPLPPPGESAASKRRPEVEELMEPEEFGNGVRGSEMPRDKPRGSLKTERGSHKPKKPEPPKEDLVSRDKRLVKGWKWPKWAMDKRNPCIEVWVEDEDMKGGGAWCKGRPQSIVLDDLKHHAFLCAEYDWDGEEYVQDFAPQHVRHKDDTRTVFDTFTNQNQDGDGDGQPEQKKSARGIDTGGGISALLDRDSF